MSTRDIATEIVAGAAIGGLGYLALTGMWPRLGGPATLLVAVSVSVGGMLFRQPHGSLRPPLDRHFVAAGLSGSRWTLDRLLRADITRPLSPMAVRLIVAWFVTGLVLSFLLPALGERAISARPWVAWVVIVTAFAVCVGPAVKRRFVRRR